MYIYICIYIYVYIQKTLPAKEDGSPSTYLQHSVISDQVIIKQINQSKLISQLCWFNWVWQLVEPYILWLLGAL